MSEPVLAPTLIDLSPVPLAGPGWARVLGNFVLFQVAWFSAVMGAARDMAWLGLVAIGIVCVWHLVLSARWWRELRLIASAMLVGALWESALVSVGLLQYTHGMWIAGIAPPWIVAMWALLAITLNVSMRWLKRRWWLAAALGAVAGPLSFMAGASLGAATFSGGMTTTVVLALGWAGLMPLVMWLAERYDGVVPGVEELEHA